MEKLEFESKYLVTVLPAKPQSALQLYFHEVKWMLELLLGTKSYPVLIKQARSKFETLQPVERMKYYAEAEAEDRLYA